MPSTLYHSLLQSVQDRTCLVGVIGLGYVGLPLIDAFTSAGFRCLGIDVDPAKVKTLLSGQSYIKHIDNGKIQSWLDKNRFDATDDMRRMSEADALLICVPTPLDSARDPDLQYV
ncbi:MAG: NAD(P)-binding domain-containing protein, partial [Planctomycetota bacterium]